MEIKKLGPAWKRCACAPGCKNVAEARLAMWDGEEYDYCPEHARMVLEGYLPNPGAHPDLKGAHLVGEYDRPDLKEK